MVFILFIAVQQYYCYYQIRNNLTLLHSNNLNTISNGKNMFSSEKSAILFNEISNQ